MKPGLKIALAPALLVVGAGGWALYESSAPSSPSLRSQSTHPNESDPEPALPGLASDEPSLPGLAPNNAKFTERLRDARLALGPDYDARTRHKTPQGEPLYTNRLILETSPYLLQHAHNPVNWHPWNPEALNKALAQDKPIFLSIGYSTCHWCHVMEHESFEDEKVAAYINEHFVAIKVDREQRPDIDEVYMSAVRLLSGRGGWPMTLVLTPNQRPFFGGTYLPARTGDRGETPGLLDILRELTAEYAAHRERVVDRARQLSEQLEQRARSTSGGTSPDESALIEAHRFATRTFDSTWGGFGPAPKFPRPAFLELLLRYHRRSGDARSLEMVEKTLEQMARGGIYDHLAGGFHRYSTDRRWLVPHFEKMLYDNAQLVRLYLSAYQITQREDFRKVADQTLRYVLREMTSSEGGFYSATDADSLTPDGKPEEGYFFTWTAQEVERALGPKRARLFSTYYGITPSGNFEGRNVLTEREPLRDVAQRLHIAPDTLDLELRIARKKLYGLRAQRPSPFLDDKRLTSSNGLMISALVHAGFVLDPAFTRHASRAAQFVLSTLKADESGGLLRSFAGGRAQQEAFLDDYAFFIRALLDVFEATSDPTYLEQAIVLQRFVDDHFWDEREGGYFMTGDRQEKLLTRTKPTYDGAEPSGNSVALMNLLRLSELTNKSSYRKRAADAFLAFGQLMQRSPTAHPAMLAALDRSLDRPLEIFLVKKDAQSDEGPLVEVLARTYLPNRTFVQAIEGPQLATLAQLVPGLTGKTSVRGAVTAFVCENGSCQLPTSDPRVFEKQLSRFVPLEKKD